MFASSVQEQPLVVVNCGGVEASGRLEKHKKDRSGCDELESYEVGMHAHNDRRNV